MHRLIVGKLVGPFHVDVAILALCLDPELGSIHIPFSRYVSSLNEIKLALSLC